MAFVAPMGAEEPARKTESEATPEKWAGLDLNYLVIRLKTARNYQKLDFQGRGFVSGTIGTKPPKGQWRYSSELWSYKMNGDWLEIGHIGEKVSLRMRPVKTTAKQIRVDTGHGKMETFEIVADGPPPPPPKQLKWQEFDLFSRALNLKSRTEVGWYLFHRDGSVSASIGTKKGGIAGPLWYWRYSGDWLQLFGDDGEMYYQMRLLKVGEKEITVDSSRGRTDVFELQRLGDSPEDTPPSGNNRTQ